MFLCKAGKDDQPSIAIGFSRRPPEESVADGFFRIAEWRRGYSVAVELFGGEGMLRLIEGVDLGLGGHLLVEGKVVGGGKLSALELYGEESTS